MHLDHRRLQRRDPHDDVLVALTTRARYWVLTSTCTAVVVASALALFGGGGDRKVRVASTASPLPALERAYPANVAGAGMAAAPETTSERDAEIAAMMSAWRDGVIHKDADAVIRLDMTFQERPDRYVAALVASSQMESNERARAFSTRTLGKFRRSELAQHFRRLLTDPSPFVRQNAAWALGELVDAPEGREAARVTAADLRRARAMDSDGAVRAAARVALAKLE